jgi:hypothetical protein
MPWSEVLVMDQRRSLPLQEGADLRELANVRDQSLTWAISDGGGGRPVIGSWRGLQSLPEEDAQAQPRFSRRCRPSTASIRHRNSQDRPGVRFQCLKMYWRRTAQCLDRVRLTEPADARSICPRGMARRADLL